MKTNENSDVLATKLLSELGYSSNIVKGGPTKVIDALTKLGIKPSDTKLYGKGISFYISEADYLRLKPKKVDSNVETPIGYWRYQRDLRTVARAILHLYKALGENIHPSSNLREIDERDEK